MCSVAILVFSIHCCIVLTQTDGRIMQVPLVILLEHRRRTKHHRPSGPRLPRPFQEYINKVRVLATWDRIDFKSFCPEHISLDEERIASRSVGDCTALGCILAQLPGRLVEGRLSFQSMEEIIASAASTGAIDGGQAIFSITSSIAFNEPLDWIQVESHGRHSAVRTLTPLSLG